jgi:hypothetical protein
MFIRRQSIKIASGIVCTLLFAFAFLLPAHAVDITKNINDQVNAGAASGGLGTPVQPQIIIATIIQAILGIFGTIFFILMIMSGYWLLTARGQEDREEKAIDTIRRAITGLVIVLMAYAIVTFVSLRIQRATEVDPSIPTNPALRDATLQNLQNQQH